MKVETSQLGEIQVDESQVYRFEQGLPGFEELHQFALIEIEPGSPFNLLQSIDDPAISFVTVSPFQFYADYEWDLPVSVQEELTIGRPEDVFVHSIVTINTDMSKATINLLAPIIINAAARLGKQHILHNSGYSSAQPILPANPQSAAGSAE